MSPRGTASTTTATGFPRMRGDEPPDGKRNERIDEFSPRERG